MTIETELLLTVYHVNGAFQLERDHETGGTFDGSADAQRFAAEYCDRYFGAGRCVVRFVPLRNPDGTRALLATATPIETEPDADANGHVYKRSDHCARCGAEQFERGHYDRCPGA